MDLSVANGDLVVDALESSAAGEAPVRCHIVAYVPVISLAAASAPTANVASTRQ